MAVAADLVDAGSQCHRRGQLRGAQAGQQLLDHGRGRKHAQAAGAEKLVVIRKESDSVKEKQLVDLRAQVDVARKELQANAAGFAQAMASKILGRSLDA